MRLRAVFFIIFLFIFIHFFFSFVTPRFIPYLGFFPYKDVLMSFNLPQFLKSFANFDGVHYLLISKNGYAQYEQAFFPLYPLLIYLFEPLLPNNPLILGLLISNISFALGLWVFAQYLKILNFKLKIWPLIFLMAFPTSFFFISLYTEGLFFLLFVSSLYFLEKKNYTVASLCVFLASLTRLIGVFLIIPILFHFISQNVKQQVARVKGFPTARSLSRALAGMKLGAESVVSLVPLLGFATYIIYLWKTTGDPLFFLNAQPAFGAHRSAKLILLPQVYFRYIKIFLTAQPNFQYFVSLFELFIFSFVFFILIWDLIKNFKLKILNYSLLSLSLFSLVNLLLPTLTGTFSSIPRYALFSLSFFITLAGIQNTTIKSIIAVIFGVVHIIVFGLFIQGYFVS